MPSLLPAAPLSRWRVLAPVACLLLAGLCPAGVKGAPAPLFTPVTEAPALPAAARTVRRRVVTMALGPVQAARAAVAAGGPLPPPPAAPSSPKAAVPAPGTLLTLNLFADVVVTGRVERTAPTFSGGYSVAGPLVEEPLGTLTLVVNGETVAGTVRTLGETYHLRSLGNGLYMISEVEEPPLTCGVDARPAAPAHP